MATRTAEWPVVLWSEVGAGVEEGYLWERREAGGYSQTLKRLRGKRQEDLQLKARRRRKVGWETEPVSLGQWRDDGWINPGAAIAADTGGYILGSGDVPVVSSLVTFSGKSWQEHSERAPATGIIITTRTHQRGRFRRPTMNDRERLFADH